MEEVCLFIIRLCMNSTLMDIVFGVVQLSMLQARNSRDAFACACFVVKDMHAMK